jgi:hypothetical protein
VTVSGTISTIESNENGRGFRKDIEIIEESLNEPDTDTNSGKQKILFNFSISPVKKMFCDFLNYSFVYTLIISF